jgi:hypothetical protein
MNTGDYHLELRANEMLVLFFFVEEYAHLSQVVQESPVDIEICFDFRFRFQLIPN